MSPLGCFNCLHDSDRRSRCLILQYHIFENQPLSFHMRYSITFTIATVVEKTGGHHFGEYPQRPIYRLGGVLIQFCLCLRAGFCRRDSLESVRTLAGTLVGLLLFSDSLSDSRADSGDIDSLVFLGRYSGSDSIVPGSAGTAAGGSA